MNSKGFRKIGGRGFYKGKGKQSKAKQDSGVKVYPSRRISPKSKRV